MEYIERMQWIEACQMFFDAYVKYQMDGTEAHWYESNDRSIEISFFDNGGDLMVKLFCPEVMRTLTGYSDGAADKTEKIITMLRWLVWEAAFPDVYDITTADSEQEYDLLRAILIDRYSRCYYTYCADDDWKGEGEERFIIALHGKQIKVCFYPNANWDANGYIDVKLVSLETGERFASVIQQDEDDPEEIIREIQRMAWENELLTQGIFSTSEMLQYNQRKPLFKEVCLCISTLAIQSIVPPVPAGQVSGRSAIISAQDLRSAVR